MSNLRWMHVRAIKGLFTWTRDSQLPRGKRYLAFTWWFVVPGQHCSGSTSLPRGKFKVIWLPRNYLNFFSFYTNCYRERILNTFTYFWCFLELFIGKFIPNINNEHAQEYSCLRTTFAFCSHGEKLPRQGRLPGVVQRVTRPSKLPRGNEKLMWTVTAVRPCTEAKLTLRSVSCPGAMSCPGIMWTVPEMRLRVLSRVSKGGFLSSQGSNFECCTALSKSLSTGPRHLN